MEEKEEEIKKVLEEFGKEAEKGIPNFFGTQRFGGKRKITHKVGKLLLQGKFEEGIILYLTETYEEEKEQLKNARINLAKTKDYKQALKEFPLDARTERAIINHLVKYPNDYAGAFSVLPKKIMYLFSHAVQSDIYNQILTERLKIYGEKALEPIEGDILINEEPAIILPGFESSFAEGKAGEMEKKIMEKEKLKFEDFKTNKLSELSSKGERKTIILKPENFKIEKILEDEYNPGKKSTTISFFLSKGNYATTILREIMKEEIY
jgi:tRNA pseudouridine13 synthase